MKKYHRDISLAMVFGIFILLTPVAIGVELLQPGYSAESYVVYRAPFGASGMAFDSDGILYVTHPRSGGTIPEGRVYRIPQGGPAELWFDDFYRPLGIVWAGGTTYGNYLYMCDAENNLTGKIYRLGTDGSRSVFSNNYGGEPSPIGIDPFGGYDGYMYIGDSVNDSIDFLDTNGDVFKFSDFPYGVSGSPLDFAFPRPGSYRNLMYVASSSSASPQWSGIFTLDENGEPNRFAPDIAEGVALRFDFQGNFGNELYAVGRIDFVDNRSIWRIEPNGVSVEFARATEGILYSRSMIFGPDGAMYVAEHNDATDVTTISRIYPIGLMGLEIVGPDEVAEGSQTQYKAITVYDNNSTKDVTDLADWAVYPDTFAQMAEDGLLETELLVMPTEQVTVYAEYSEADTTVAAEKDVDLFAMCPEGSALEFDGDDDYIEVPDAESFNVGNTITLQAWIKSPNVEVRRVISSQNQNRGSRVAWLLRGGAVLFRDSAGQSSGEVVMPDVESLNDNRWHHIAGTLDDTKVKLYVDSILRNSTTFSNNADFNARDKITIGNYDGEGDTCQKEFFGGDIDEVAIYKRALSAEEIQGLMYSRPNTNDPDLVGYWNFDEGQGQIAYDSSGNGNDGYLGTDPCGVDSSDPSWVDSDVPYIRCTREQMVERNLYGAMEDKAEAAEKINSALAKEKATKYMLWQMCWERDYQLWHPWQIWRAVTYILHSMIKEENCRKDLVKSERDLERAVETLELGE